MMGHLTLKRLNNGLFVLTFYEKDYQIWEKYFIEVDNALKYFVQHPELGNRIEVEGTLYL